MCDKLSLAPEDTKSHRTVWRAEGVTNSHGPYSLRCGRTPCYPNLFSPSQPVLQLLCFKLTGFIFGWKVCWWTDRIFGDQAEQDMPTKERQSNFSSANPFLSMSKILLISDANTGMMSAYYTVPWAPFCESTPQFPQLTWNLGRVSIFISKLRNASIKSFILLSQ